MIKGLLFTFGALEFSIFVWWLAAVFGAHNPTLDQVAGSFALSVVFGGLVGGLAIRLEAEGMKDS